MTMQDEFMAEGEVAAFLGMTVAGLRNWAALRKGPPRIKAHGRKAFYRREALTAWLESRERTHDGGHPRPSKTARRDMDAGR